MSTTAPATLATLRVVIRVETAAFNRSMERVNSELKRQSKLVDALTKRFLSMHAVLMVFRGMKHLFNFLADQEMQMAKLKSVLEASSYAIGFTSKQLDVFATSLQRATAFTKNEVILAQTLAATFIQIRGIQFEDTVRGILDLSVAMGTGLRQAAIQLSKVLNNPIQLLGALRRSGVSFNKVQEDMIKGLWKAGKVVESQNEILRILQEQGIKGTATAMRDTMGGALKGLWNDMAQVSFSFFEATGVLDGLKYAFNSASGAVQKFDDKMKGLNEGSSFTMFWAAALDTIKRSWLGFKMTIGHMTQEMADFNEGVWTAAEAMAGGIKSMREYWKDGGGRDKLLAKQGKAQLEQIKKNLAALEDLDKEYESRVARLIAKKAEKVADANKAIVGTARDAAAAMKDLFKTSTAEGKLLLAQKSLKAHIASVIPAKTSAPPVDDLMSSGKKRTGQYDSPEAIMIRTIRRDFNKQLLRRGTYDIPTDQRGDWDAAMDEPAGDSAYTTAVKNLGDLASLNKSRMAEYNAAYTGAMFNLEKLIEKGMIGTDIYSDAASAEIKKMRVLQSKTLMFENKKNELTQGLIGIGTKNPDPYANTARRLSSEESMTIPANGPLLRWGNEALEIFQKVNGYLDSIEKNTKAPTPVLI